MGPNNRRVIVLGITDLFFRAKIEQIARISGSICESIDDPLDLKSKSAALQDCIVVYDLEKTNLEGLSLVSREIRGVRLLGFYPHRNKELPERSRSMVRSGVGEIVPRSGLEKRLVALLNQKRPPSKPSVTDQRSTRL